MLGSPRTARSGRRYSGDGRDPPEISAAPSITSAYRAFRALEPHATSVFTTRAWADTWCRHVWGDRELRVLVWRRADGEVAGVLPLCVIPVGPVTVLRQVGFGAADEQGPLCAPAERDAIGASLEAWVAAREQPTVLLLERTPAEGGWRQALGRAPLRHAASPVLPVRGRTFDELLSERSRNLRDQARRYERRLRRDYRVTFRLTRDPERLPTDFAALIALHGRRWGGRSRAFSPPLDRFHAAFASEALQRGWLRLWTLELDGHAAASFCAFRHGDTEWYYQAGRDPALDAYHVGFVLLCQTIRAALEDGVARYRFGLGAEAYKYRFAEEDPGVDTFAWASGLPAQLALGGIRTALATPAPVRRLLTRAGR